MNHQHDQNIYNIEMKPLNWNVIQDVHWLEAGVLRISSSSRFYITSSVFQNLAFGVTEGDAFVKLRMT